MEVQSPGKEIEFLQFVPNKRGGGGGGGGWGGGGGGNRGEVGQIENKYPKFSNPSINVNKNYSVVKSFDIILDNFGKLINGTVQIRGEKIIEISRFDCTV